MINVSDSRVKENTRSLFVPRKTKKVVDSNKRKDELANYVVINHYVTVAATCKEVHLVIITLNIHENNKQRSQSNCNKTTTWVL